MKKFIILLIVALCCHAASAQNKPKKKKDPTMEEAMKELEKQMENMDPETRKMMEQMGLGEKIKDLKKKTANADSVLAGKDISDFDPNKIPDKPSAKPIAPTPAGKQQMAAYLRPMFDNAAKAFGPQTIAGLKEYLNKGKETGKTAMAFWIENEMPIAYYLLLNACISDPEDYESLNNLGALLTMWGFADRSLPILQYVEKQFPNSPTLLNNIGQAWLSQGHIDKAKGILKKSIEKDEDKKQSEAYWSLAMIAKYQGNMDEYIENVEKSVESGGDTPEAIDILVETKGKEKVAEYIRHKYRKMYKDHAITKRFRVPATINSWGDGQARGEQVTQFYKDLEVTNREAGRIAQEGLVANSQKVQQLNSKMLLESSRLKSPKEVFAFNRKYYHPLKVQAKLMLLNEGDPTSQSSYNYRMQKQIEDAHKKWRETKVGLDCDPDKMSREAFCNCLFNSSEIVAATYAAQRDEHARKMEDLLRLQMQEMMFWSIVDAYPNDPTPIAYAMYSQYLTGINNIALRPGVILVPPGAHCKADSATSEKEIKGKLRQWELDHCEVYADHDWYFLQAKMDCKGFLIKANLLGAAKASYAQEIDPVTAEKTRHTINVETGGKQELKINPAVVAAAGFTAGGSITFDGGGNVIASSVTVSGNVSVQGPAGTGGSIGAGSITVSNTFNGAGPTVSGTGTLFGK